MSQLPINEALNRFKDNESRLDLFVNDSQGYTASDGQHVESIPAFLERIETLDAIAQTQANKDATAASATAAGNSAASAGSSATAAAASAGSASTSATAAAASAAGLANGVVGKAARAELNAALNYAAGTVGMVTNDPTPANNGTYLKSGASGSGSWTQSSYDRVTALETSVTENLAVATSQISGAFEALVNAASAASLTRGTYTAEGVLMETDIYGWRSPFKHNGSRFNAVQTTLKGATSGVFRVEIQDVDHNVIAYGRANVTNAYTAVMVPLNKMVTTIAADGICWIAYYHEPATIASNRPAGGAYDAGDANPATYPEQYYVAGKTWDNGSSPGSYRINFRLLDMENVANLADAIAKSDYYGKLNIFPDSFFREVALPSKQYLGRKRWWGDTSVTWAAIDNPLYDGKALRNSNVGGASNLGGPVIWLDESDLVAGDTMTLRYLVTGSGGNFNAAARFMDINGNWVGGQITGSAVSPTNSTPKVSTLTTTVPAGATRLALFPFVSSGYADVLALWGYPGAADTGPEVPNITGSMGALQASVAVLTEQLDSTADKADYMLTSSTEINYDSLTITAAVTGPGSTPRDYEFCGWGQTFTPQGISFNAIRTPLMTQTRTIDASIWSDIVVFVRTGSTPDSGGTIVAKGSVKIDSSLTSLSNTVVLLRDPVTNAIKTITNSDLNSKYMVAVYALNRSGGRAACGQPTGTTAGNDGQSWHFVTAGGSEPESGSWVGTSGDTPQAFEHLLLVNPSESVAYTPTQDFKNDLGVQEFAPEIILPTTLYGLQGLETGLYYDNAILQDWKDYVWKLDSGVASGTMQNLNERFKWTPAGAVTSGDLLVRVVSKNTGAVLSSKTINLRAAASNAGSGATKKVIVIGDSLINNGNITATMLAHAGSDVMGLTLYGIRGSGTNKHEGRGGWSTPDYTTFGRTYYYQFSVNSVSVPPTQDATYTNNGSTFTVEISQVSGGVGIIKMYRTSGTNAPSASGTLTKTGGTGDAAITFTSSANVPGNPFWIEGQINFASYLTQYSFPTMDWVIIQLGINDVFGQGTDEGAVALAQSYLSNLDNLIASIKASNAGTKVALMIPSPPSYDQDSFALSEGFATTRYRFKRNIVLWAKTLIAKYSGQEASRIYVVPSNLNLDTSNNMNHTSEAPINSRSTVVTARQNNGVHPATEGYQQLGDAVWAFLKYNA
jgi:lysophospholipase L1-like esterase